MTLLRLFKGLHECILAICFLVIFFGGSNSLFVDEANASCAAAASEKSQLQLELDELTKSCGVSKQEYHIDLTLEGDFNSFDAMARERLLVELSEELLVPQSWLTLGKCEAGSICLKVIISPPVEEQSTIRVSTLLETLQGKTDALCGKTIAGYLFLEACQPASLNRLQTRGNTTQYSTVRFPLRCTRANMAFILEVICVFCAVWCCPAGWCEQRRRFCCEQRSPNRKRLTKRCPDTTAEEELFTAECDVPKALSGEDGSGEVRKESQVSARRQSRGGSDISFVANSLSLSLSLSLSCLCFCLSLSPRSPTYLDSFWPY